MRFKPFLTACVLAASFCSAQTTVSIAPDAASKEDVKKLFEVMLSRDQMTQMMQPAEGAMVRVALGHGAGPRFGIGNAGERTDIDRKTCRRAAGQIN